ncbi:hypothetical protein ACH3XW_48775 [Acanthocheilonema viteae]
MTKDAWKIRCYMKLTETPTNASCVHPEIQDVLETSEPYPEQIKRPTKFPERTAALTDCYGQPIIYHPQTTIFID